MIAKELYDYLKLKLPVSGFTDTEARLILEEIAGISWADLITSSDRTVDAQYIEKIERIIDQRRSGKPLGLIFGHRAFYGLDFKVTKDVLEPRPDSEILVECAVKILSSRQGPSRVLDLGTGSGCLIITTLHHQPNATGVAVDISAEALEIARENAKIINLEDRIQFLQSHWTENLNEKFDLILCNPPYIETGIIESLSPDVRNHDPILALDGGIDGLDAYRDIFSTIKKYMTEHGTILFEIGATQQDDLMRIAINYGFIIKNVHSDYGGNPRVAEVCCGDK